MSPDPGHMVLHDVMQPALPADNYRIRARTDVSVVDPPEDPDDPTPPPIEESLREDLRYFDVVGPRFVLAPTEIAGVFPPRNGRGPFELTLPHAAFGRKTLPWENDLDPNGELDAATGTDGGAPALDVRRPSMALLLFEESEVTVERGRALESVLPSSVRTAIDAPTGVVCDAIAVRRSVLLDVLPTPDEMTALTHVREVNVEDRELAAGDSDGWFSVIMANRLPEPGRTYRACVVSLEGRSDLFAKLKTHLANPPHPPGGSVVVTETTVARLEQLVRTFPGRKDLSVKLDQARARLEADGAGGADDPDAARPSAGADDTARSGAGPGDRVADRPVDDEAVIVGSVADRVSAERAVSPAVLEVAEWVTAVLTEPVERVVLLSSWTFECTGTGTFRSLCLDLDVGMIGDHAPDVRLADTGHVALQLRDRDGGDQIAWYRGPLAPYPVTRDPEGPYHSADQCRRVSPETGMEDVSFSAAFEVGRLLATSDGRLAQELMRWRRTAYRAARRSLSRRGLATGFDLAELADPRRPLAPLLSARVAERVLRDVPRIDRFEAQLIASAPGLDPVELTRVWRLADLSEAEALLGGAHVDEIGLGPEVVPAEDVRVNNLRQLRAIMMDSIDRNGV
ncbi:MAG TPA: hypothetical protein VLA09_13445 [Longimicrobiales bacterium]|nr:hypothetical protein [Longimicrobiales bacterium]